ncbi:hypothetical protein SAMN05428988_5308 [Chitinophaga sp. YR573]|uniref:hypothetical protein n=1 Tax=Chitinophaga sp. YR573 TaxID=1881040 RepID=UPI0008BAFBEA|nr:hypothetical protein [Chitinophaga sp. YR573]SEW40473.1 hypothetical protein SAMN05428988_5308 [Chitinophaga sp. YR573]
MIPLPQNQAAVNWTFGQRINSLRFTLNIPSAPIDSNGSPTLSGVYLILYDQWLNDTGCYLGLQTNLMRPNAYGGHTPTNSFGLLFSRWQTRDNTNLRISEGGFEENAEHEGGFIGVRMPFPFIPGIYTVEIKSSGSDESGIWYTSTVLHPELGEIDCGSIRFPFVEGKNPGLVDGGGTNLELYKTTEISDLMAENEVPNWDIIIENVIANGNISPQHSRITYPYRETILSNVTTPGEGKVIFQLGNNIARANDTGQLF